MSGCSLHPLLLVAWLGAVGQGLTASASPGVARDAFWSAHVEPVLREHCLKCHGEEKRKSGHDLRTPEGAFRGGDRGPAVLPGRPAESLLFTLVHPEGDPEMPPPASRPRALKPEERESLRTWIERLEPRPAAAEGRAADNPAAPVRRVAWTPPAGLRPAQVVDGFLERSWKVDRIQPSRPLSDTAWVRRVYLDLAGRLPTGAEGDAFLSDRSRDRRWRLVDRLLDSPDHAAWMAEVFDTVLLGKADAKAGKRRLESGWAAFLTDAFRRNRPWDAVVRGLIAARPERPEDRGAVWFLYERNNNPQAIAEALAPVVFGVQIQCAQCHDHMVAREIKQAHYWGLVAAFNRSKNVETPSGPAVAESAVGGFVTFANLKKESQPAKLVFFNGRQVEEAWPAAGEKPADDPALYLVPPPKEKEPVKAAAVPRFSRRTALAEAVARDNPLLARAMVNRLWALVFGRGLVHPVELMDSKHPPSHPELLDWLAADFARSGHDVRRLLRELVHSRAYQLDSRPAGDRRPPAESFACALAKPLTAGQLERSWATVLQQGATNGPSPEFTLNLRRLFPQPFEPEYHASLHQALFLANNPEMQGLLKAGPGLLVGELARRSPSEAVERAFRAVYGRRPDASERRAAREFLATHPGETGVRDLAWSLATSAEFLLGP